MQARHTVDDIFAILESRFCFFMQLKVYLLKISKQGQYDDDLVGFLSNQLDVAFEKNDPRIPAVLEALAVNIDRKYQFYKNLRECINGNHPMKLLILSVYLQYAVDVSFFERRLGQGKFKKSVSLIDKAFYAYPHYEELKSLSGSLKLLIPADYNSFFDYIKVIVVDAAMHNDNRNSSVSIRIDWAMLSRRLTHMFFKQVKEFSTQKNKLLNQIHEEYLGCARPRLIDRASPTLLMDVLEMIDKQGSFEMVHWDELASAAKGFEVEVKSMIASNAKSVGAAVEREELGLDLLTKYADDYQKYLSLHERILHWQVDVENIIELNIHAIKLTAFYRSVSLQAGRIQLSLRKMVGLMRCLADVVLEDGSDDECCQILKSNVKAVEEFFDGTELVFDSLRIDQIGQSTESEVKLFLSSVVEIEAHIKQLLLVVFDRIKAYKENIQSLPAPEQRAAVVSEYEEHRVRTQEYKAEVERLRQEKLIAKANLREQRQTVTLQEPQRVEVVLNEEMVERIKSLSSHELSLLEAISNKKGPIHYDDIVKLVKKLGGEVIENGGSHKRIKLNRLLSEFCLDTENKSSVANTVATGGIFRPHKPGHYDGRLYGPQLESVHQAFARAKLSYTEVMGVINIAPIATP